MANSTMVVNMKSKNTSSYLRIESKLKYSIFLVLYFVLFPFAKLLYGRKDKWLICEMRDYAQDNGFIFFEYLVKNHSEIKPIYLLNKNHYKFNELSKLGKVIPFGSFRHFLMAIGCHVKISSQIFGYAPWIQMATYFRRNKTRDIHVFLQHGIIKNTHENLFGNVCRSLDIFVCGAKPEYDFIKSCFHYDNDAPKYTGLARYDKLNNKCCDNQLLFMPTWRSELKDVSDEEFTKSDFYINWSGILTNKKLNIFCKQHGLRIVFYLHHEFQRFSNLFESNDIVSVIKLGEKTVQQLLIESKLLVTDFSSVYFDFAYMKKPMVYFQFDESTFYDCHYQKGYFDYRRDGFGPVCLGINDVINNIIEIVDNDFAISKDYMNRINLNFLYNDDKNCERIYKEIVEVEKKRHE